MVGVVRIFTSALRHTTTPTMRRVCMCSERACTDATLGVTLQTLEMRVMEAAGPLSQVLPLALEPC